MNRRERREAKKPVHGDQDGPHRYVEGTGGCPACGDPANGATNTELNGIMPSPGDLAICGNCASVSRYGEGLKLELYPDWKDDVDPEQIQQITRYRDGILRHQEQQRRERRRKEREE